MKISYNWLKDYLPLTIEPYQLADRLSLVGLEVEEVIEKRLDFEKVVVGKVLASEPHPNADKLRICRVDVGDQELSVVCGAPNVAAGQTVPVAKVGARLPNGMVIKKAKIRGTESEGMICSQAELGLEEHSEGIWVLPENLPLGVPLAKALDFETDFIFDIAVTPNRPDCLSHLGIAREVAAITGQKMTRPPVRVPEIDEPAEKAVRIRIESPQSCPRYSARVIRKVKIGPSPTWLVRRLEAVGMRSINNIVDITNYVMMETGHPLHAFDFDLIAGREIIVRESREGEKFVTLDDKERVLKAGTVLICDAERPVAIGGIMGGLNSEVTQDTVNILLESAYFQPESIQRSARYLGLSTEASQRFERGADPNGTRYALDRATALIAELAGGEVLKGVVDVYPHPIKPWRVPLKVEQINTLLGTDLSKADMGRILESIELTVADDQVVIPTFRPDLTRVADLAEEVARLYGLDNIPAKKYLEINYDFERNEFDYFVDWLRETLTGMGLQEVITPSMINRTAWEEFTGEKIYPILNPISRDMDGMRNSLVPSLAQVIQYNQNRQIRNLRIFEINRTFQSPEKLTEMPVEEVRLALALSGKRDGESWYSSKQPVDFYDIKGIVEALIQKISLDKCEFIYYSNFAIGKDGLALQCGKETVAFLGRLSDAIARHFELEEEVFVAEFSVPALFRHRKVEKKYQPVPRFPAVERDLAFVVDEGLEVARITELIWKNGGKFLRNVDVFDIYRGKQIPEGKKSVAFRLVFQSGERTLTEEEVNQAFEHILKTVSGELGVKLRDK